MSYLINKYASRNKYHIGWQQSIGSHWPLACPVLLSSRAGTAAVEEVQVDVPELTLVLCFTALLSLIAIPISLLTSTTELTHRLKKRPMHHHSSSSSAHLKRHSMKAARFSLVSEHHDHEVPHAVHDHGAPLKVEGGDERVEDRRPPGQLTPTHPAPASNPASHEWY